MNLDFSEEQKELKQELARFLRGRDPRRCAREVLEGRAAFDGALWRDLGQLGWLSVAMPRESGGQELGHEMLCCVAEEIGRYLVAVPFGSSIALAAEALMLFGSDDQKQRYLPGLGSGERIGAFAIAERPGPLREGAMAASVTAGRLSGRKIAVADGLLADLILVAALADGVPQLFLVEAAATGVEREAGIGVDPAHAPASIRFEGAATEPLGAAGWSGIRQLLDRAAVLTAFEQVGTADAALAMATDYTKERMAFGRQIGSFQAIKHKLADVWIANELARANAYYAAWALEAHAEVLPRAAAAARVSASEALERAARELIQVHGGIAVTWAHDAHLFYRRAQHLALVLGGLREWQGRLTALLAAAA